MSRFVHVTYPGWGELKLELAVEIVEDTDGITCTFPVPTAEFARSLTQSMTALSFGFKAIGVSAAKATHQFDEATRAISRVSFSQPSGGAHAQKVQVP